MYHLGVRAHSNTSKILLVTTCDLTPKTLDVRELRNAIQRSCLLCRGDVILPDHLPPKVGALASSGAAAIAGRLSQVERAAVLATLDECKGNRTHAATKLGISRRALIYKLQAIEAEEGQKAGG
jgi:DNA-binding NtrC family response regulator